MAKEGDVRGVIEEDGYGDDYGCLLRKLGISVD